jgi:D-alanyl-D-alanine carboxypeptidase
MNQLRLRTSANFFGMILLSIIFFTGCTNSVLFSEPVSIQQVMNNAVEGNFDGMIVYMNQAGKSSFYSSGYNNRDKKTPVDPHSLFKIASISKLFLAAAATKLVADEQLSLDAKLSDLLPEVTDKIEYANEITLEYLLQHRSGITDYSREPEVEGETSDDYMSYMTRVYGKEAKFKPNTNYNYSNSNYLLLGEIMNRTLGYSHQKYIQDQIIDPLGLSNTYNVFKDADTSKVMSGYIIGQESDVKSKDFPLPGGNMVATAEDVGTFLRALIDGTLFTNKEQEIYSSVYEYEHTGWLPGYCSIARYHKDIDAVIVQFVNTSGNELFWIELEMVYNRIVSAVKKS